MAKAIKGSRKENITLEGQGSALWVLAWSIELASIYRRRYGSCTWFFPSSMGHEFLLYINWEVFTLPRYYRIIQSWVALEETIFEN